MSQIRYVGYLTLFALRDVFPVTAFGRDAGERLRNFGRSLLSCVSTLLNLFTLAIIVLTTTLVAGLQAGTVAWIRDYVESNPMARTVEVSSTFGTRTASIDAKALESLRHLEGEGVAGAVSAAHGWNDVTFWFYSAAGTKEETLTHGRTVDPDDPLLATLACRRVAERFSGEGVGQILVSRAMLAGLGYDADAAEPPALRIEYFETAAPLAVLGVCDDTPAGEFLITESFNRRMEDRQWDPVPQYSGLYWGPIQPGPALDAALAELRPYLEGKRIGVSVETVWRAGNERWLSFRREPPWSDSQWRQIFLPVAESKLRQAGVEGQAEFPEAAASAIPPRATLERRYTRASLYVAKLEQVPAVADRVSALGFRVTSNSRELALLLQQISALGRGLLLTVILVVGGLGSISLGLSVLQGIQRKTAEIALLKAFGISRLGILAVYLIESTVLWLIASSFGLFVAGILAGPVEQRLLDILRLRGVAPAVGDISLLAISGSLMAVVAIGAFVLCTFATILASSVALRLQPAQALNSYR